MLPRSHHPLQPASIDHLSIGKPPLRPIHPHRSAAKRSKMPLGPAMNLIALGHRPSSSRKKRKQWRRHSTVATFSQSTQIHNVHSKFANQKTSHKSPHFHHFKSLPS